MSASNNDGNNDSVDNLFKGLEKIVSVVGNMIDSGENVVKYSGSIKGLDNEKIKSAYNLSVKLGINDGLESLKSEFKNRIQKSFVEPGVDIFDEDDKKTIIILVNNISEQDIHIESKNNGIIFEAKNPNVHYYKEIETSDKLQMENLKWTYKNGVIKIDIPKKE